jgi:hypothetical protein
MLPMRFGIMCEGTTFPAWQARTIEHLLAVPGVEPALLIVDDRPAPERAPRYRTVLRLAREGRLAWGIFNRLFVQGHVPSLRTVDLSARLSAVAALRCRPETRGKFSEYFPPAEVAEIRRHGLDFILRFAFGIVRGDILSAARHGVWSFHHDDPDRYRGTPPGFWEIAEGDPLSGAMLQRLTERLDGGVVLQRGWFATVDDSYAQNLDQLQFGGADWPARVCRDIGHGTADYLDAPPLRTAAPVRVAPRTGQMAAAGWTLMRNFIRNQLRDLFRHEEWHVGVVDRPIEALLDGDVPAVRWLPERPAHGFLADPFGLRDGQDTTVLVEAFDYASARGVIAAIRAHDGGPPGAARTVIDCGAHMSYPFLLRRGGDVYCIPETGQAREIALYRARHFPHEWERVATLVAGFAAVDATVFERDGRWWLFCTDDEAGPLTKLFAWHAPDLLGPWTPHAQNPLKTDVRSSRPAGTPFQHAGQLYRPAQDCTHGYGGAVVINRVLRLTTTEFAEEVVARVEPDPQGPYPEGLHTVSAAGDLTLVDGKRSRFHRAALARALRNKLGSRLRRP